VDSRFIQSRKAVISAAHFAQANEFGDMTICAPINIRNQAVTRKHLPERTLKIIHQLSEQRASAEIRTRDLKDGK
jgi:hypothetical protein